MRVALAVAGGSNSGQILVEKRWSIDNYAELAKILVEKGHEVILVGGKSDIEDGLKIKAKVTNHIGLTTLLETAEILKSCDLVVCNDGGIMHLASAMKTPVISIFGPTDPRRLAPLGENDIFIWDNSEPCYNEKGQLTHKNCNCINKVTVERVLKVIEAKTWTKKQSQ